jgi:hypothetical protein
VAPAAGTRCGVDEVTALRVQRCTYGESAKQGLSSRSAGAPADPSGAAWVLSCVAEGVVLARTYNGRHPDVVIGVPYAIGT